jgi:flagellar hook-length control protein FliK
MNLRGIVAVSGRPGLYKLVGQNKGGYVLESLDAQKVKIVANITTTKLASLEDITIYGEDDDLKLVDVLANIKAATGTVPDAKSDAKALKSFFEEVAPNHDQDKVYSSDMKKIITWYHLLKDLPLFTEASAVAEGETETVKTDDKIEKKVKATPKLSNAKAPAKTSQPAKKASMTSKKGV